MKKIAKILLWIISSIFVIALTLSALVQINWIQYKLVIISSNYLTNNLGINVSVESVNLQPFKGDFSFTGVKCNFLGDTLDNVPDIALDTTIAITCNELSISGLDLILHGGEATNVAISDLHIKAKSIHELEELLSNDTAENHLATEPWAIDKLIINHFSWDIGEDLSGETAYLELLDIISTSKEHISIASITINNTQALIPEMTHLKRQVDIAVIKGSLEITETVQTLTLDTINSNGLNISGEIYSSIDGEIESNAIFSLYTDTITTSPELRVGVLQGEFNYENGTLTFLNVDTEKGIDIHRLSLLPELKTWELEASTNNTSPLLNIIASGTTDESSGLLIVDKMGEVTFNASINEGAVKFDVESKFFTNEFGDLSNIKALMSTDLSSSFVDVNLNSNEIDMQGVFSSNLQEWRNWMGSDASNHSKLLSTGSLTIKESGILFDHLHEDIVLSPSNSTTWEIYTDSHKISSTTDWIEKDKLRAEDLRLDIEGGSVWTIDTYWKNNEGIEGNVRMEGVFEEDDWTCRLHEATIPIGSDYIALTRAPAEFQMRNSYIVSQGVNWSGGGFEVELMGAIGKTSTLALSVKTDEIDSTQTKRWFDIPFTTNSIALDATIGGSIEDFNIDISVTSEDIHYKEEVIPLTNIHLLFTNESCTTSIEIGGLGEDGDGEVLAVGSIDIADISDPFRDIIVDLSAGFENVPLDYINPFLQPNTAEIGGTLTGIFTLYGDPRSPIIEGDGRLNNATVKVPYLGTNYDVVGNFHVAPDAIELNGLEVGDGKGGKGFLVGTAFHDGYSEWNVDVSLIMDELPIEVMNIPPSTESFFYGSGFATGDVNVFGYDGVIVIEANLTTTEGTEFVLPTDVSSKANWSSFIHIHSDEEEIIAEKIEERNKTVVELNLNIDVTPVSKARIIFDETLGDEIIGSCLGQIHIGLDDFERLEMFGALEVVEGSYLFTLGNFISKKFTAKPGGMISWFGDPYEAEINLETYYSTRTSIRPIVPEALGNSKQKVELILALKGELMRPGIAFDIQVHEADERTKAALASLIANEEERNRQAISLLVLQQFLPAAWQSAAIGSTGIQENSTELISAQLGSWLSGLSDDVSIGIDYDAANEYGDEAALAIALSTELLNDRLHIEGEVGTTNLYTGTMDEIQLQDIRLKYDITDNGNLQLTGYSTQRASIPGLEGESVQGVGIIFHKDFDKIRDFFKRED